MTDEKKDPQFKPNELEPMVPVTLTLKKGTPVAEGDGDYGSWYLWPVFVENAVVFERDNKSKIENYTGDAICFPSSGKFNSLHEQFLKHTGGTQENVKITVTLVPKKGTKGFYTTYETKLVEAGATPANVLTPNELRIIDDFKKFTTNNILNNTEDDFLTLATSTSYGLSLDVAKKLWNVYNE
jgi:hypothetical protein